MYLLHNQIMPYAWGSSHAIAELLGRPASGPEAELWLGAHPQAPSRVPAHQATLAALIAASPSRELGAQVAAAFAVKLPFLTKVLAAAAPLSLQAHPSKAQAAAGFARENALGISLNAANRNYRDDNHKPELICALTPFRALCGFRNLHATHAWMNALGIATVGPFASRVFAANTPEDLRQLLVDCLHKPTSWQPESVAEIVAAAARCTEVAWRRECVTLVALGTAYPNDAGILVAALLNVVELDPGEAIYLPAGNLHAYLDGVGIEIMASSDNVLRGGLTPKHVDCAELASVLRFETNPVEVMRGTRSFDGETTYTTPAREFQLSRIELAGELQRNAHGPEVVLVTDGACELRRGDDVIVLARGQSAFIAPSLSPYSLSGEATIYRSIVP
jgi:mannose-6-phosphate isomerase